MSMGALAFYEKKVYRGQTTSDLRLQLPRADILIDSPVDLNVAAWMHGRPNCTIYALIEKLMAPYDALKLAPGCGNNPVTWFDALLRVALPIKNNFTSTENKVTSLKPIEAKTMSEEIQPEKKSEEKKLVRKHLDKSLKIKKLQEENPRRAGTKAFKAWELIQESMTVAEYIQAGGNMQDLLWEVKHNRLSLS